MPRPLSPGEILDDRYELLVRHAQGGMATVWVGRVRGGFGFERIVAIKTILPHMASDERFRTMFLDEARIAARIRHPNVAHLEDVREHDGVPFMVLEWIEGDPLSRISDTAAKVGQPTPLGVLLRILADTCAGLHAAHELRDPGGKLLSVVHRDVSHQNILVTTEGVAKVIDFGVAKAAQRLSETTRTGFIKGKLEYACPEYLLQRDIDRRADVWAIGVILYRELAGRFPFEAPNDIDVIRAITRSEAPPPLPPGVPPAVAALVMKALAHDPRERFATADELRRALETALPELPGQPEVAAYVNELLAARIEVRRRHLAEALARANGEGEDVQASVAAPVKRAPLASLPPEAVPLAPDRPPVADELTEEPDPWESEPVKPRLRLVHLVAMALATLLVLGVWGGVVKVLQTSPKLNPTQGAGR